MVVLTLALSTIVMVTLGLILEQQITAGLLRSKIDAATAEIDSARQTVQASLSGADSDPSSLREQLKLALGEIGRADGSSDAQGSTAGVFEPVIVPSRIGSEADLAISQPTDDVPAELRARIGQGQIAYQYTTITRDGQQIPALVMGSPARTSTDSFEVYLIFPLAGELGTVQVVQRTLLLGGIALAVALTLISALVAAQVVRPVRRAAASARKLAAGDLAERMPVSGPIELATLANSFNGMAEAIRVQIRQLEEFGKLQRRFTSDVSHELRTPLTTVRMAADILHDGREDFPPHLARSTELLVDELDRFESLLADLLEISRYDAGMAELERGADRYPVQHLHQHRGRRIGGPPARRRHRHAGSGPPGGRGDRHQAGGSDPAQPAVQRDRPRRRPAGGGRARRRRRLLAITVTDHGVGLRPGEAGLVFNRFWRADPSRQRQTGGTGLGLAISLEDARLHGGWLQASGAPGEGARFRLTLPRQRGGLITQSPLPLRIGAEQPPALPPGPIAEPAVRGDLVAEGVRMMVEDGTLKPVPSDDELHPETVPSAGASAALSVTDQPAAPSIRIGHGAGQTEPAVGGQAVSVSAEQDSRCAPSQGRRRNGAAGIGVAGRLHRSARFQRRHRCHPDRRSGRAGRPGCADAGSAARPDRSRVHLGQRPARPGHRVRVEFRRRPAIPDAGRAAQLAAEHPAGGCARRRVPHRCRSDRARDGDRQRPSPGLLDTERSFHTEDASVYSRAIHLMLVDGEWRITDPPPELLLTSTDFPTAYRQRVLYFLDQSGTVVVPDIRHVVIGQTPANRASRLLSLLMRGPSSQLAGGVTTQFTSKSSLRSNPSVDSEGVLQVDLTGVDVSTPEARRALAAQIVWTLSPTSPRITITVDGEPLDPAQPVYTINSVSSFDPDRLAGTGQVASDPFYVTTSGAVLGLLDGQPVTGPLGSGALVVSAAAQSSATGVTAAVAADPAGGQQLVMARPAEPDRPTRR